MQAKDRVRHVPFNLSADEHTYQHLPGRYSGISVCRASARGELYLPQRARSFVIFQDSDVDFVPRAASLLAKAEGSEQVGFEKKLRSIIQSKEEPPTRYACLMEAHGAGSYLAFLTKFHSLYFWGAFNWDAEILCWSTNPDFGPSLADAWWTIPLDVLTDDIRVIHVHRMVQRWIRWSNGNLNQAQRFLSMMRR